MKLCSEEKLLQISRQKAERMSIKELIKYKGILNSVIDNFPRILFRL